MDGNKLKTRTAAVSGTGRTSFQFDATTWAAIDLVAEQANMTWVQWAARAIQSRPNTRSKAAAVKAALADALMKNQYEAIIKERGESLGELPENHPIVGKGYYRLDDQMLDTEMKGAEIVRRDNNFTTFTMIVGYRDKARGGNAFVCILNGLRDGLHLFIVKE